MSNDIRVGDCIVRPQRRLIDRGDESIHITPRAMSVFECLAAARGTPVSRNELFEKVWRGAEVSDDALTKCIGELRRAFGDSALEFELLAWIEHPEWRGRTLDQLNCEVYRRFAEAGIEVAFPQRDLHVRSMPEGWRSGDED